MNIKLGFQTQDVHDMTTDTVDVVSTSNVTADTSPIVLSQTEILRFSFLPTLVDNEKEPHKSVSGKLLYEKKRKNDDLFPRQLHRNIGQSFPWLSQGWRLDGAAI